MVCVIDNYQITNTSALNSLNAQTEREISSSNGLLDDWHYISAWFYLSAFIRFSNRLPLCMTLIINSFYITFHSETLNIYMYSNDIEWYIIGSKTGIWIWKKNIWEIWQWIEIHKMYHTYTLISEKGTPLVGVCCRAWWTSHCKESQSSVPCTVLGVPLFAKWVSLHRWILP